jgi:Tat protein secretion system quality control protein TatD with DNase activity
VELVAEEIARIKQLPVEVVAETTTANAVRLFSLVPPS